MKGIVDPLQMPLWQAAYEDSLPIVRDKWRALNTLYNEQFPEILFDTEGPYTDFNLRYKTHVSSNATELLAMDYIYRHWLGITDVAIAFSKEDQDRGFDLVVKSDFLIDTPITVSVKTADMSEMMQGAPARSFSVHETVRYLDLTQDESYVFILVDPSVQRVIVRNRWGWPKLWTSSSRIGANRYYKFYDLLGGNRSEITQQIRG